MKRFIEFTGLFLILMSSSSVVSAESLVGTWEGMRSGTFVNDFATGTTSTYNSPTKIIIYAEEFENVYGKMIMFNTGSGDDRILLLGGKKEKGGTISFYYQKEVWLKLQLKEGKLSGDYSTGGGGTVNLKKVSSEFSMPEIILPDYKITPSSSPFSGIWEGFWQSGRFAKLVVINVSGDTAEVLYGSESTTPPFSKSKAYNGSISKETITMDMGDAGTMLFHLDDSRLKVVHMKNGVEVSKAELAKK